MSREYCRREGDKLVKYDGEVLMGHDLVSGFTEADMVAIVYIANRAFDQGRKNAQMNIRKSLGCKECDECSPIW